MAAEEQQWRDSSPSIIDSGDGLQGRAVPMDVDDDETMDQTIHDDDITPGCYVLDIDIERFKVQTV
jgi:hypothetical protein